MAQTFGRHDYYCGQMAEIITRTTRSVTYSLITHTKLVKQVPSNTPARKIVDKDNSRITTSYRNQSTRRPPIISPHHITHPVHHSAYHSGPKLRTREPENHRLPLFPLYPLFLHSTTQKSPGYPTTHSAVQTLSCIERVWYRIPHDK